MWANMDQWYCCWAHWTQTVPQHLVQPHPVCIETICFSVYSSSECKTSPDHQDLQCAIPFLGTKACLHPLSYLSPYPNIALFSPSLTLISFPPSLCCCLCQKDHILRLVIACLLDSTPVAVNVVVWDEEENYALWPLWHETSGLCDMNSSTAKVLWRSRKIMWMNVYMSGYRQPPSSPLVHVHAKACVYFEPG